MNYNMKMVCDIKGCEEFPKYFPKSLAFCEKHWKEIHWKELKEKE